MQSIDRRYEQANSKDIQLSKLSYAHFDTKLNILSQYNRTKEELHSAGEGSELTNKLVRLKSDVSNGNPIIHDFSERGVERGIGEMVELIDHMNEIQQKLERQN